MLRKFSKTTIFMVAVLAAASTGYAQRGAGGGGGGRGGNGGGGGGAGGAGAAVGGATSGSFNVGGGGGSRNFSGATSGSVSPSVGAAARTATPSVAARARVNTGTVAPATSAAVSPSIRSNVNAATSNAAAATGTTATGRSADAARTNNFARDNNTDRNRNNFDSRRNDNFGRNLGTAVARDALGIDSWQHRDGWRNDYGRDRYRDWDRVGYGFGWYYPYAFYPYVYSGGYGSYYGYDPYYSDYGYATSYPVTVARPAPETIAAVEANDARAEGDAGLGNGEQFYNQARKAFASKNYQEAVRLAGHAAVDAPRSEKVHELLSLSLFAMGDYRGASAEAHAAASLGPVADWSNLRGYYQDGGTYKEQIAALSAVAAKADATPDVHFLLGYHYMMQGYHNHASKEFAKTVELAPKDEVAKHLTDDVSKMRGGLDAATR